MNRIDYKNANIISSNPIMYNDSALLTCDSDIIIGSYSLLEFRSEVNHGSYLPTYTYLEEKQVIESEGEKILPYEINKVFHGRYFFEQTDYLYIKNVLISNTRVKIPFLVEGIELKGLVINVRNKKIIPNVSRNNISDAQNLALSYAIGKALHMWIYEYGGLEGEEKELILKFINKCYSEKSDYLQHNI